MAQVCCPSSLHWIIAVALLYVDQLYSGLMVPMSYPWSANIPPQDSWERSPAYWWAFQLLPWYALVLSQSGCWIPSSTRTQNLSSHVLPCCATGELNWCLSIQHPARRGWYVEHCFLVTASKHSPAPFRVSPKPLQLPENCGVLLCCH